MSRLSITGTIIVIVLLALTISCSRNGNPTEPCELSSGAYVSQNNCFGEFRIIPSEDLSSAEILPIRTPQFNVTEWAVIEVLGAEWNPILRNWTLSVQVSNPSPYTGWGVQAIFTNMGGKELRWPDGFVWIEHGTGMVRHPFFAIEKTTPQREFPGLHSCVQDLTFHFPEGVDKWIPIAFYIDAHLFEPRPDPMVEDLDIAHFPPPCQHATVTARIGDHQSDTGELDVWVDLSPVGGSYNEPMYDDGEHDDGLPDDGIFGAEFTGGTVGEVYTFTVFAKDPESNYGENDVIYSPISYPPLPPIVFETMFNDQFCMLADERLEVIGDQAAWESFWADFSPWDMPPPVIDFDANKVIAVCIGERPDDCYSVKITGIVWSDENCGWKVNYTETVPGEDCICDTVITSPFHLITVNNSAFDIMFEGDIYVDECSDPSDPCLDLEEVASGTYCNAFSQSMTVIKTEADWISWWNANIGGGSPETIDFDTHMLIAVTMGTKNTSGFFPTVDSACLDDDDKLEIEVGWHIPGEGCMVMMVITTPWVVVSAQKSDAEYYWTTYNDVYPCD